MSTKWKLIFLTEEKDSFKAMNVETLLVVSMWPPFKESGYRVEINKIGSSDDNATKAEFDNKEDALKFTKYLIDDFHFNSCF